MAIVQVDTFLKLDGIDGESQDSQHTNQIEIQSLAFGVTNSGTAAAGKGVGGKHANFNDVHMTKYIDKSSPNLMIHCANGKVVSKAYFYLRKAGQDTPKDYCTITLTDLLVSHYSLSDAAGMDLPMEQVSFNYTTIKIEYKTQNNDGSFSGSVTQGWDLKANKTV